MVEVNEITERIIGAAIEVHRGLGPGLLESAYEKSACAMISSLPAYPLNGSGRCPSSTREFGLNAAIVLTCSSRMLLSWRSKQSRPSNRFMKPSC